MRIVAANLFFAGCLLGLVSTYVVLSSSPTATAANSTLEAEIAAAETGEVYLKLDEASQRVALACRGISVWERKAHFELPPRNDLQSASERGDGSGGFVSLDFGDLEIRFAPPEHGSPYFQSLQKKLDRAWARTQNRLNPNRVAQKPTGCVLLRIRETDARTLLRAHDSNLRLVLCPVL